MEGREYQVIISQPQTSQTILKQLTGGREQEGRHVTQNDNKPAFGSGELSPFRRRVMSLALSSQVEVKVEYGYPPIITGAASYPEKLEKQLPTVHHGAVAPSS